MSEIDESIDKIEESIDEIDESSDKIEDEIREDEADEANETLDEQNIAKKKRPRQLFFSLLNHGRSSIKAKELAAYIQIENALTKVVHEIELGRITNVHTRNFLFSYGIKQAVSDYKNTLSGQTRDDSLRSYIMELHSSEGLSKSMRAAKGVKLDKQAAASLSTDLDLTPAQQKLFDIKLALMFAPKS